MSSGSQEAHPTVPAPHPTHGPDSNRPAMHYLGPVKGALRELPRLDIKSPARLAGPAAEEQQTAMVAAGTATGRPWQRHGSGARYSQIAASAAAAVAAAYAAAEERIALARAEADNVEAEVAAEEEQAKAAKTEEEGQENAAPVVPAAAAGLGSGAAAGPSCPWSAAERRRARRPLAALRGSGGRGSGLAAAAAATVKREPGLSSQDGAEVVVLGSEEDGVIDLTADSEVC